MKLVLTKSMYILKQIVIYGCLIIIFQIVINILKDISSSFLAIIFDRIIVKTILADLISLSIGIIIIQYIMKKKKMSISWMKVPDIEWVLLVIGLFTSYILIYKNTLGKLLDLLPENPMISKYIGLMDENTAIALIVSMIISGPILEELLIRGLVLKKMLQHYSAYQAIILSSILFAVLHFDIKQGINALIIGIILGYVYYKTEAIIICIILHIMNNAYIIFSELLVQHYNISKNNVDRLELFAGVLFFVCIVLMYKQKIKIEKIKA